MGVFWKGLAFSVFPLVITRLFSNYYIYLCFVLKHKIMLYFLVKRNIKLSELKQYHLLALCLRHVWLLFILCNHQDSTVVGHSFRGQRAWDLHPGSGSCSCVTLKEFLRF